MKYQVCVNHKVISSYSNMKRAKVDYDVVQKVLESVIIGENVVPTINVIVEDDE